MSETHAFAELTENFSPERRERIEVRKKELRAKMPLHRLRQTPAKTRMVGCKGLEGYAAGGRPA